MSPAKSSEELIGHLTRSGNEDAEEQFSIEPEQPEEGEAQAGSEGEAPPESDSATADDSLEVVETESEDDSESDGDGEPQYVTKDEFDEVHREAVKRRHANKDLREQLKIQSENIAALHQAITSPPEPPDPAYIEASQDPAVQAIRDDINRLRQDAGLTPENLQRQEQLAKEQERRTRVMEYVNASRESFESSHPDYKEALNHTLEKRGAQLSRLGYSQEDVGRILNDEARDLAERAYENGQNPAKIIYEMATQDYGYSKQAPQSTTEPPAAKPYRREMSSVERIRKGLQQQSVDGMQGDRGGADTNHARGKMTREEFLNNVDAGTRLQVMADQAKFEELAKTGEITVDW